MRIELEKPIRGGLARALAAYLRDELDAEIGGMDAVLLLDFISEKVGPHFYNQALYDVRARLLAKMEALTDAVLELEKPAKL